MRLEQLFEISIPETDRFVAAPAWPPAATPLPDRLASEIRSAHGTTARELVDFLGWDEV